jgi:hypothetical protein
MKLFFTISSLEGQPQSNPLYSLGGFCSSSQVSSEEIGTIFSLVSEYSIDRNKPQYICLCLKNISETTVKDIAFWFDFDDEQMYQCKYRVAFSMPLNRQFENVPTIHSKPVYAEFDTADGMNDAIGLPDMNPNDVIGIWIERKIDQDCPEVANRKNPDWLFDEYFNDRKRQKQESFDIKIKFEYGK